MNYRPIKHNSAKWSTDQVKAYIVAIIAANDQRYAEQFIALKETIVIEQRIAKDALQALASEIHAREIAQDKAVQKAEVATDKRLESMNEFRQKLSEDQHHFITRNEATASLNAIDIKLTEGLKNLNEKINSLSDSNNISKGKTEEKREIVSNNLVTTSNVINIIIMLIFLAGLLVSLYHPKA